MSLNIGLQNQFEGLLKNCTASNKQFIEKFIDKHPEKFNALCTNMKKFKPLMIKLKREDAQKVTEILTMEQLKEGLQIAVELELTVLYEYLFACFSIVNSSDEVNSVLLDNLASFYSEIRREYKNQIIAICIQEMQHFRMASDMLISVGGLPNIRKVNFPSQFGSFDQPADLIRLNHQALTMFTKNEEPEVGDAIPLTQQQVINPFDLEGDFVYIGIAQLYSALAKGFQTIHDQIGDMMFKPKPFLKTLGGTFYTTLEECLNSITIIKEQGEGSGGGKLFKAVLEAFRNQISKIKIPESGNYKLGLELQKQLVDLSNTILAEIEDEDSTVKNLEKLIGLYEKFVQLGFPPVPFNNASFLKALYIDPSHWGRFLIMLINYVMLYTEKYGQDDFKNDNEFSQIFSRPSQPRPLNGEKYKEETQLIVDIANLSFQLLIKLLEALFIVIPNELNDKYKIQERYNHIKYFPIMTILLYPLGELVSYFQLSGNSTKFTAGLPFSISGDNNILTPLDKFEDITLTIAAIYKAFEDFNKNVIPNLDLLVGQWIENKENREKIVTRVKILIEDVRQSIEIIYKGFTNSLPPRNEALPYLPPAENIEITHDFNRFYINIEFSGYILFLQASDPDPTFDPRGFSGNMFMYEETGDPNFTRHIHTQNDILSEDKPFTREFVPRQKYDGVKITQAKLVIPDYQVEQLSENEILKKIDVTLKQQLVNKDFFFKELVQNDKTIYPSFPQINYALTNQIGIDPVNIVVESPCLNLRRANLFVNPKTDKIDPTIDYVNACLLYSNNFDPYPYIMNDRLPASGGYVGWVEPYQMNNGGIANTNQINTKSGTGQNKRDYYLSLAYRQKLIRTEIDKIIAIYDSKQYPLASQIKNVLNVYPSKLILLALMSEIPATNRNRLSYLCSRFVQIGKMLSYIAKDGNFKADLAQYFYHIPLNGQEDYLQAEINSKDFIELAPMQIVTDETWSIDFWIGGMDYDALALFMNGNLMVPVTITLDV